MKKRIYIPATILILSFFFGIFTFSSCTKESVNVREKNEFNRDWRFALSDSDEYSKTDFDDSHWRLLDLPHDWSIEGDFSIDNPAGTGGGALPGGTGWYRKTFVLPESDSSKRIYITFDGVYQNSEVFINGNLLGKRPNGYISFQYDLTPFLKYGDSPNVIAVRVDNSDQPNSRWYSGSGIYRNVWLEKTNLIHIDLWGTHITTSSITEKSADVEVTIIVRNTTVEDAFLTVETLLVDQNDHVVARATSDIEATRNDTTTLKQKLIIYSPKRWSIENPYLYKAINILKQKRNKIDQYETTFGVRYFNFDVERGFSLNGKTVKIKGVCLHHDLGALGSAVNKRAIERQLEILKVMGCNGIRTSHNPPAPELLDLCDQMGFIVQDETFDCWAKKKVEYDYSLYWDEWHVNDLTDHLLRDRNHPSVFSWSIGNEVLEQWDSSGIMIAKELSAIVKKYAPDVPVTAALNFTSPENYVVRSGALDLIGYNYSHDQFEQFPEDFPGQRFIASETTSSLNSRGEYDLPADSIRVWPYKWDELFYDGNEGNTCSSYDNCHVPWGSTHEATWQIIKKYDYLSGMYIWTGFDYLGEPTPYQWPSRSSYFGIVDLAGFPKDAYYFYQSEWTDKPVLHLFPHWNWQPGQNIDLWVYTNFDEVELFLNGKSKGIKKKTKNDLHLSWNIPFKQGEIKAIGKNKNGDSKEVIIYTAGLPARLKLSPDRMEMKPDGRDLIFIEVSVLDKDGNLIPHANNLIQFQIDDLVSIAGVGNGNQISHEPFKASFRKTFNGKCLLIIKSGYRRGQTIVRALSKGLDTDSVNIKLI